MEIKGHLRNIRMLVMFSILIVYNFVICSYTYAVIYVWKDSEGASNFTDNPAAVPKQYQHKIKTIERSGDASTGDSEQSSSTPADSVSERRPIIYGGHDEIWWRESFKLLRQSIARIMQETDKKRQELTEIARERTLYHKPSDRLLYNRIVDDVARKELQIKELNEKLQELDNQASRNGVPRQWRE